MKMRVRKCRFQRETSGAGRLWSQATRVFGSRSAAARWFREPAIGLESRRPIDLIWTADGVRQVHTLLERIGHGVYT